jgi:hypothetical protein
MSEPGWPREKANSRARKPYITHALLRLVAGFGWCLRKTGTGLHDVGISLELWAERKLQERTERARLNTTGILTAILCLAFWAGVIAGVSYLLNGATS